jgi:hypothetical protein
VIKAILAALCTASVVVPTAAGATAPSTTTTRSAVTAGSLTGVSVISRTSVWAVGSQPLPSDDSATTPVIEHWNGRGWAVTPSPAPGYSGAMTSVSAMSRTNVWAVGNFANASGSHDAPFAVHWNGRSWRRVALPKVAGPSTFLTSVTAITAKDAWAVGDTADTTLTEHWNGHRWRVVASSGPRGNVTAALYGVAGAGAAVWAVGEYRDSAGTVHALTERWSGHAWTRVPTHDPAGSTYALFWNVAVVNAHDVWATGFSNDAQGISHTLIERWNGKRWRAVPSPDAPTSGDGFSELYAISATSATNAWAVGTSYDGKSNDDTLIEHWNGTRWAIVPSPNRGGDGSFDLLFALSTGSANDIWTVGEWGPGGPGSAPLVEHWNGHRWRLS